MMSLDIKQIYDNTIDIWNHSLSAQTVQDAGRGISLSTTFSPPLKYVPIKCHSYGPLLCGVTTNKLLARQHLPQNSTL